MSEDDFAIKIIATQHTDHKFLSLFGSRNSRISLDENSSGGGLSDEVSVRPIGTNSGKNHNLSLLSKAL